jgi:hypothetical protein
MCYLLRMRVRSRALFCVRPRPALKLAEPGLFGGAHEQKEDRALRRKNQLSIAQSHQGLSGPAARETARGQPRRRILGLDRVSILRSLAVKLSHLIAKSPTGRRTGARRQYMASALGASNQHVQCVLRMCVYMVSDAASGFKPLSETREKRSMSKPAHS